MGTIARTALRGFAGTDAPEYWPRPRSAPRPDRLVARSRPRRASGRRSPAGSRARARRRRRPPLARPRRYEEPAPTKRICDLFGEEEAVSRSSSARRQPAPGRLTILTARVADETGEITAIWFNQPWLEAKLPPGTRIRMRGRANRHGFAVSSYDLGGDAETGDFAPVYPATEDVAQKTLRDVHAAGARASIVGAALPAALRAAERLPMRADALVALHRPRSLPEAEVGRSRLAFDELLVLRSGSLRRQPRARARLAQRWARPVSSWRGTATRCRSR